MSSAAGDAPQYTIPTGILGLKGPVAKPAPGTLPLRGDLAHIALAGTHLAGHYVIPTGAIVAADITNMRSAARDDADITLVLERGQVLEVLDIGKDWVWCCLGAQGPSGYISTQCLTLDAEPD